MPKEIYYLNQDTLPAMPVPHDCIIKSIALEGEFLVFSFTDDISRYDSVSRIRPDAKSLIIRYHLVDEGYWLYKFVKPGKIFFREGAYKGLSQDALFRLADGKLEYLDHFVSYESIIIKMYSDRGIILGADVDYVEYEWIYQNGTAC